MTYLQHIEEHCERQDEERAPDETPVLEAVQQVHVHAVLAVHLTLVVGLDRAATAPSVTANETNRKPLSKTCISITVVRHVT